MPQDLKKRTTILVVDDEDRNRQLLESFLGEDDYELYMAECGSEALLLAEGIEPDLILLDLMMPVMDGYAVCREIRRNPNLTATPIIMITALEGRDSMLRGLEAGADEFLTKPVDCLELRTRVRTVARLNRVRLLQRERKEFEMIAEDSRDIYLRVSPDGDLTYLNNAGKRLINPQSPNILNCLSERFALEPHDSWMDWRTIWQHPEHVRYLLETASESSCARWFQFEMKPVSEGEQPERLCRIIDVTDLMNTKRDNWSFQSAVCHKLRTPLTGIVALTAMLRKRRDDAELWDLLEKSTTRLESQVASVTNLVDSRQSASFANMKHSEIMEALRNAAEAAGIERLDQDPETPSDTPAELSRNAVEMIAAALFENCVRFHPEGTPSVLVSSIVQDEQICISIADDGTTIPPEDLPKLGKLLFQSESSFTGEVPGMGVGLAMVDSILRERGGKLSFRNRSDVPGFVVTLKVPVAENLS